jgi:hypothetical protein
MKWKCLYLLCGAVITNRKSLETYTEKSNSRERNYPRKTKRKSEEKT